MNPSQVYEKELSFQADRRRASVKFISIVNDLWYEKSIELVLFRNSLINKNVGEILKLHEYAGKFVDKPISIFDSTEVAEGIKNLNLPPSKLDIGKLTFEYLQNGNKDQNVMSFLSNKLKDAEHFNSITPKDVVLYGFGRIGRLIARELMAKTGKGNQLRLRAIVTRGEITQEILEKRASLLKNDSIHADFNGTVQIDVENSALIINDTTVKLISANKPEDIDYTVYGIKKALIIDNTGAFRDEEALKRHLQSKGADKVLLTAPGKGIPNIVHGVNHKEYDIKKHSIFSAASCTTNAITPVLKAMEDHFGIEHGHLETIHAYTNDQNLVDNMHSKYRRGRAAALNMVITETGAGKAVAKALPQLEDKLTSNAIRVPVPNGSLAILNLNLKTKTSKEELNNIIKEAALNGDLVEQIKYSINNELVSSDIVGVSAPAIFDSHATITDDQTNSVVLYIWYDNEFGYSHQVIRLAKYVSNVRRFTYY
ncbi:glyceraldehyde-3-phosphate dehydrogenase [Psychroflexus montanilacus]|uniref:glyceraldehyde-3-phosphate dehydrogenase n=1 Tax=Psychroflexus montanilacus TaxID=2873598 RepID=UPI001CCDD9A8|nr:glyceraldehyde-3-phosphate dehydrogenase [Psychroflexus montanilacus]MBZ9653009.1 glyceraldehyde-3-phosphate dehydrogenase [Psychroflexus montanilacus]